MVKNKRVLMICIGILLAKITMGILNTGISDGKKMAQHQSETTKETQK